MSDEIVAVPGLVRKVLDDLTKADVTVSSRAQADSYPETSTWRDEYAPLLANLANADVPASSVVGTTARQIIEVVVSNREATDPDGIYRVAIPAVADLAKVFITINGCADVQYTTLAYDVQPHALLEDATTLAVSAVDTSQGDPTAVWYSFSAYIVEFV